MGARYVIDSQQQCVFSTYFGTVSEREVAGLVQTLWNDPQYDPAYARVLDCTEVAETTATPEFWRALACDFGCRSRGRLAVVATSRVMRRLTFVYCHHLKTTDSCRFFARSHALRWLMVREPRRPDNKQIFSCG